MTTSEREQAYKKIGRLLYTHPNEKITLIDGTTINYSLYRHDLPLPKQLPPLAANEPAGLYVDEIFANEDDALKGVGVKITLSASVNIDADNTEYVRMGILKLEDADDELLNAIVVAMLEDSSKDMPHEHSADDIIANAWYYLKHIIACNIKILYYRMKNDNPNFDADEDYTVDITDYDCEKVHFRVTVSDLRTDYEAIEDRTVKTVRVTADNIIFIESEEDDGYETSADELSTDELAALALWSEQAISSYQSTKSIPDGK